MPKPLALLALALTILCVSARANAQGNTQAAAQATNQATTPPAPTLEFVFEEIVTLGTDTKVGTTPWGDRNIVPITGGTFAGPRIKGKILPGGWDWQLTTPGGCFSLHANYMIQADDGAIINVDNKGTFCKSSDGKDPKWLTTPSFEAPKGPHDWLNGGAFVGTLQGTTLDGKRAVRIRYYQAR